MRDVFLPTLISDVLFDDSFAASTADGGDVVAVRPELASPEFFLERGDEFEKLARCDTLDEPNDLSSGVFGKESEEQMHMVLVEPYGMDINRIPLFEPAHDVPHELRNAGVKERLTIFYGELDVVVAFGGIVIPVPVSLLRLDIGSRHSSHFAAIHPCAQAQGVLAGRHKMKSFLIRFYSHYSFLIR